ncbi:hypothetical protein BB561_003453 [Smittium simulii]|uniref:SET domain-containing protein n=1 Tax=Smittium simulii TaxID=133385 RepID=A0A2T9YLB5_9FUNG|nr:hypothetical protein BB561_003453 [Smittium simulii]
MSLSNATQDREEESFDYDNDEDQGIIRCICGFTEDDGFTIQCENCLVWQHAICVNISQDNVPDEYLCEQCNPRKLNFKRAAELQRQRLDKEYKLLNEPRKKSKPFSSKNKKSFLPSDEASNQNSVERKRRSNSSRSKTYDKKSEFTKISSSIISSEEVSHCIQDFFSNNDSLLQTGDIDFTLNSFKNFSFPAVSHLLQEAPLLSKIVEPISCQVGVFSTNKINKDSFICEYKGRINLKTSYLQDPKNHYDLLRLPRPHVIFHPNINLCVDARFEGDLARNIRRSCTPNIKVYSLGVSEPSKLDNIPFVALAFFALHNIDQDDELTLPWDWEDNELPAISKLDHTQSTQYLLTPEGRRMSKVWKQAFFGSRCTCYNLNHCRTQTFFDNIGLERDHKKINNDARATNNTLVDNTFSDSKDEDYHSVDVVGNGNGNSLQKVRPPSFHKNKFYSKKPIQDQPSNTKPYKNMSSFSSDREPSNSYSGYSSDESKKRKLLNSPRNIFGYKYNNDQVSVDYSSQGDSLINSIEFYNKPGSEAQNQKPRRKKKKSKSEKVFLSLKQHWLSIYKESLKKQKTKHNKNTSNILLSDAPKFLDNLPKPLSENQNFLNDSVTNDTIPDNSSSNLACLDTLDNQQSQVALNSEPNENIIPIDNIYESIQHGTIEELNLPQELVFSVEKSKDLIEDSTCVDTKNDIISENISGNIISNVEPCTDHDLQNTIPNYTFESEVISKTPHVSDTNNLKITTSPQPNLGTDTSFASPESVDNIQINEQNKNQPDTKKDSDDVQSSLHDQDTVENQNNSDDTQPIENIKNEIDNLKDAINIQPASHNENNLNSLKYVQDIQAELTDDIVTHKVLDNLDIVKLEFKKTCVDEQTSESNVESKQPKDESSIGLAQNTTEINQAKKTRLSLQEYNRQRKTSSQNKNYTSNALASPITQTETPSNSENKINSDSLLSNKIDIKNPSFNLSNDKTSSENSISVPKSASDTNSDASKTTLASRVKVSLEEYNRRRALAQGNTYLKDEPSAETLADSHTVAQKSTINEDNIAFFKKKTEREDISTILKKELEGIVAPNVLSTATTEPLIIQNAFQTTPHTNNMTFDLPSAATSFTGSSVISKSWPEPQSYVSPLPIKSPNANPVESSEKSISNEQTSNVNIVDNSANINISASASIKTTIETLNVTAEPSANINNKPSELNSFTFSNQENKTINTSVVGVSPNVGHNMQRNLGAIKSIPTAGSDSGRFVDNYSKPFEFQDRVEFNPAYGTHFKKSELPRRNERDRYSSGYGYDNERFHDRDRDRSRNWEFDRERSWDRQRDPRDNRSRFYSRDRDRNYNHLNQAQSAANGPQFNSNLGFRRDKDRYTSEFSSYRENWEGEKETGEIVFNKDRKHSHERPKDRRWDRESPSDREGRGSHNSTNSSTNYIATKSQHSPFYTQNFQNIQTNAPYYRTTGRFGQTFGGNTGYQSPGSSQVPQSLTPPPLGPATNFVQGPTVEMGTTNNTTDKSENRDKYVTNVRRDEVQIEKPSGFGRGKFEQTPGMASDNNMSMAMGRTHYRNLSENSATNAQIKSKVGEGMDSKTIKDLENLATNKVNSEVGMITEEYRTIIDNRPPPPPPVQALPPPPSPPAAK